MELVFDAEWCCTSEQYSLDNVSHIWCVVFKELDKDKTYEFSGKELNCVVPWLEKKDDLTLIGHNILGADLEIFRRHLCLQFSVGPDSIGDKPCTFVDTLVLSRTLKPDRDKVGKFSAHSLDAWAYRLNGVKPQIQDWQGLSIAEYLHRCREDVKLTEKLYYEFTAR